MRNLPSGGDHLFRAAFYAESVPSMPSSQLFDQPLSYIREVRIARLDPWHHRRSRTRIGFVHYSTLLGDKFGRRRIAIGVQPPISPAVLCNPSPFTWRTQNEKTPRAVWPTEPFSGPISYANDILGSRGVVQHCVSHYGMTMN